MRAGSALIPRVALAPASELPELHASVAPEARFSEASADVVLGRLGGAAVVVISEDPVLVRVARALGADVLVLVRTARALDPDGGAGELAVVADHLGVLVPNPLIGPNPDDFGPRFPDMSEPYDRSLQTLAREEAVRAGGTLAPAVYAAVADPNLATPAEYRMLRQLGADVVGKGGVPQVIVARHAGMRVLSLVGLPGSGSRLAALAHSVVARLA